MKPGDIRNKDYICVDDRLFFSVISDEPEQDKLLCWLRYIKDGKKFRKLTTTEAAEYIQTHYPKLIFHSKLADSYMHGIPHESISQYYFARRCINTLKNLASIDSKQTDALAFINLIEENKLDSSLLGITGSLLINVQNENSDIDLLVYGRDAFFQFRSLVKKMVEEHCLSELNEEAWRDAYQRRECDIGYTDYLRHEKRKFNKCMINDTKVDITMIPNRNEQIIDAQHYQKQGKVIIKGMLIDDQYAYDTPARYYIDNKHIKEVVVYTATYVGQAVKGEMIEVCGVLEKNKDQGRLVVGTSREAKDEYIKVIVDS